MEYEFETSLATLVHQFEQGLLDWQDLFASLTSLCYEEGDA